MWHTRTRPIAHELTSHGIGGVYSTSGEGKNDGGAIGVEMGSTGARGKQEEASVAGVATTHGTEAGRGERRRDLRA